MTISLGARYMVLSAFAFAVMGMFVKLAAARGIPTMEIVAARALISLLISIYLVKRYRLPPWGNHRGALLARGVVGFFALTCIYYALVQLPIAEATVLQYLYPVFTAVLGVIVLRERAANSTVICIVLSTIGVVCIARPDVWLGGDVQRLSPLGIALAITGALGSACAYVLVRKLNRTEHPLVIVLYFPLVTLPATLPFLWHEFVIPQGITWWYLLALGVATQVGQVALTKGIQLETASRAASFSYTQVVFAIALGILVFDETPHLWTLCGAVLILSGAYISAMDASAKKM